MEYLKSLVALGWIEGLVKLVGHDDAAPCEYPVWASGVICKIGNYAFWFGGEEAESYQSADKYIAEHNVGEIIQSITEVLNGFAATQETKDEYGFYTAYLEDNVSDTLGERIPYILEYLRKFYSLDGTNQKVIENVLYWAAGKLQNLPEMQVSLVRECLDIGLCEEEFQGILGYMNCYPSAATEIKYLPGDILQIGADDDVPEYRVITTRRTASDENGRPVTMYGFVSYWDRELQHEKLSNTARLPEDQSIKIIGRTLAARLIDFFYAYRPQENPPRGEQSVFRMEENLRSNGMITDMIGLIEQIVQEEAMTDEQNADADQLLRDLISHKRRKNEWQKN